MRYFLYDKIHRRAVNRVDPNVGERIDVYMRIYDLGGCGDGTNPPTNPFNFYVEKWRDNYVRCMNIATTHKPDSEYAKMSREALAAENGFDLIHLVSLEVPTDEFENMIRDFKIKPVII